MSDLIDRQAAIDELKKTIAVNKNPHHDARIWEEGMNCAVTIIGALQSVHPETCDTCKHGYFGDDCDNCCVGYPNRYERRTDEPD